MLLDTQEKFLTAFAEYGHDGAAASISGVAVSDVFNWKKEEEFNQAYNDAFHTFSGTLVKEAISRGRDGYEEPIIYRGEVQYLKDNDTGELLLDDSLMPIPATIKKKSDRLLQLALRANLKEYQPNSSIELTGTDGQPLANNITVEFIKPKSEESLPHVELQGDEDT